MNRLPQSGTPTEFKVPNVNCESAVNDPLTEVTDFKDVHQGPHFHQCVHIRNTVYYPGSFENGRTRISIGNGEIGGVTAYFDERIHFFKGDSMESWYVDQSWQRISMPSITVSSSRNRVGCPRSPVRRIQPQDPEPLR